MAWNGPFTNFHSYENFVNLIQYLDLVTSYFVLTPFQMLLFHVFHVKNLISHILIIIFKLLSILVHKFSELCYMYTTYVCQL